MSVSLQRSVASDFLPPFPLPFLNFLRVKSTPVAADMSACSSGSSQSAEPESDDSCRLSPRCRWELEKNYRQNRSITIGYRSLSHWLLISESNNSSPLELLNNQAITCPLLSTLLFFRQWQLPMPTLTQPLDQIDLEERPYHEKGTEKKLLLAPINLYCNREDAKAG